MPAFLLKPACTDYLWGGEKLRTDYHIESDCRPLAEAWVLSCHPDGPSALAATGQSLPDYIKAHPGCLGTDCDDFAQFPVLVKLIDARDNLSIQVHPSDDYALAHEHQYGKTEMWVVLDAEPGVYLYYGFSRAVTREEFARRIRENTLPEVLNAVPVHKGDVFFIPSGTLHAICRGIVIAEIQQSSNVTYRVYDYGRVGADGHPRALHIPQALAVTDLEPTRPPQFEGHLGSCRYFTADACAAPWEGVADARSFVGVLVVEGVGTLECSGETLPLHKGSSVFITAGSGRFRVTGDCRLLLTRV